MHTKYGADNAMQSSLQSLIKYALIVMMAEPIIHVKLLQFAANTR